MTWGHALPAALSLHSAIGEPVLFRSRRGGVTSGHVKPTDPTLKSDGEGPLILSATMQREAMILDHRKATLRRDMRAVNALDKQLQRLTHRILSRGA